MLEIGSIIDGKYKILNVVGKGGMSVVYLAMNEKANKQWAIKEVRKDGMQNFEVVKQNLIVETDLLKRLKHPHLPSIIDVIDRDGTFLIVMDYIEGNPLSKALETEGAQNQEDVIEWAKQLCDVLGYLHSRKPPIIYRDMKPSNIMLKPDGNVMLIDFGTAREYKSDSIADTTCLGTQGYAAPEQFGGQGQTDARTDIYCLGATLYHLVTGHNPCTPPYEMYPIRQWNPMLSSGLEEIIIKCTQRNPNDRYQSCAELLYELNHYTDLDIENKKIQSFKWKMFLTSVILMFITLFAGIGLGIALNMQISSTYDSYMRKADNASSPETQLEYYKEAIKIEPSKTNAYIALLTNYLSDAVLSEEEYRNLRKIIYENEEILMAGEPEIYANEIAFPIGQALFFSDDSDGDSNERKKDSVKWFKRVLEIKGESGEDQATVRSKKLLAMAENYSKIPNEPGSNIDKYGDEAGVSPKEYWNELQELMNMDWLTKTDNNYGNSKMALIVYRYVASELASRDNFFFSEGSDITVNDYKKMKALLSKKIEEAKKKDSSNSLTQLYESACVALEHVDNTINTHV